MNSFFPGIIFSSLLSGCVYMGPLEMEEPIIPPVKLALERVGHCPVIEGVFRKTPEVFRINDNEAGWMKERGTRTDYASAFPFNDVATSRSSINPPLRRIDFFEVAQESDSLFSVLRPRKSGDVMFLSIFSEAAGNFACGNGRIIYPETRLRGGSEGGSYNLRFIRHLMRAESGELVFYEQSNSAGRLAHRFFIYPEVEK